MSPPCRVRSDPVATLRSACPSGAAGWGKGADAGPRGPAGRTTEERLRDLQGLRDGGVITDEEYQAKRKDILQGL